MNRTVLSALLLSLAFGALAQKPADVTVQQVNDRRTNGSFSQLVISVQLPKVPSSQVTASRVLLKSAVDDAGVNLVDSEKGEPELEPNYIGSIRREAGEDPAVSVSVNLKNPSRKATKVSEVRGDIELYMPGKDPNSVAEAAKFISFSGKPLSHKALKANGVEISLVSAAQVAAEKKKIADAKRKEYKESGWEDGEDLENLVKSTLDYTLNFEPSDVPVRIKDPNNRIQEIVYIDGAGERKNVSVRDQDGMQTLSTWGDAPQPDWKLRVSLKTSKNVVRYPFALKDIALP